MVRVAAAAVTAALCAAVVRRGAPELGTLLILCAGIWILSAVLGGLGEVAETAAELAAMAGLDRGVVEPVLKTVALSILTRLTVEVCRGAGEGGIGAFVEAAGTVLALAAALPLVRSVMKLMAEMLL